ncbi:arginase [Paenibacillus glycanilyticus]|uniref:Arginase n=1 Tax=Paenibacillus glycanilyticus TaxID=126569 RepID=A0ABQ6GFZ0_9BACL|nr:arginase [Paenibacillus glycanilyticus]GLX68253.1 arginase [Paenibacillus glycanilyticus]
MTRKPRISLISAPFGLGAGRAGSEQAPDYLIQLGLTSRLLQLGCNIDEMRKLDRSGMAAPSIQVPMNHAVEVLKMGVALAEAVETAVTAGRFPFVLGGDHSLAMGTLAGLTARHRKLGVIWIDAHADMNTESTSPSGNMHGIPLAVALGRAQLSLSHLLPGAGTVAPGNIVLIGARDLDPPEEALIWAEGITCYGVADIRRQGMASIVAQALNQAGLGMDGIHLSFDIDSIDPSEAPGTGTPVQRGLTADEAREALRLLASSAALCSAEFVEVNPLLDRNDQTSKLAIELIALFLSNLAI